MENKKITTVNSLSGGKTSSYIAKHYPADYNLFSLVTTIDRKCLFPDEKIRQIVSDKIGKEFIGTLEEDMIIYTMLDLEQFIGREINWINEKSFDEVTTKIKKDGTVNHLVSNVHRRECTVNMKILPLANWIVKNLDYPVETRIGFRANEQNRAKNMIERTNESGFVSEKFIVGKTKTGNSNKWKEIEYQRPAFPLIEANIFNDQIVEYWKDKPVRFAYMNNCVGCFHRNPIVLKHMSNKNPNKFQWFVDKEKKCMESFSKNVTWRAGTTYEKIQSTLTQLNLFDEDFNECDSGHCGL
jgi:hypothetical protein